MAVPTDVNSPLNAPSHTGEHQRVSDLLATAQNYPRGIVMWKVDFKTSPISVAASTETSVFNAGTSFTPLAGRRYRLVCQIHALSGPNASYGWMGYTIGGTRVPNNECYFALAAASWWDTARTESFIVGDGVSKLFNWNIWCAGALTMYAEAPSSMAYIEDVGV